MRDIVRIAVVVMLIAGVSGGALAYAHSVTAPAIERALRQAKEQALAQVLPGADRFEDRTEGYRQLMGNPRFRAVHEVWEGLSGSDPVGTVVVVAPTGYGGPITCLVGIGRDGKITGIQVLSAPGETPGLGSRVKEPAFLGQFTGQAGRLAVDTISGATISSRAVVDGVQAALDLLAEKGH
ncbi:MAG: RnfABCDGE type electron transport complex subunit G [Bacillota bacterium]